MWQAIAAVADFLCQEMHAASPSARHAWQGVGYAMMGLHCDQHTGQSFL